MDKQREMFEDWQLDTGRTDPLHLGYIEDKGRYALNVVQGEWEVWQAAQKAQWQPIENPPDPYTEVIVWPYPTDYCMTAEYGCIPGRRGVKGWYHQEYETGCGVNYDECFPKFWMPLPQEPTE